MFFFVLFLTCPFHIVFYQQINAVIAASMSLKNSHKVRKIMEVRCWNLYFLCSLPFSLFSLNSSFSHLHRDNIIYMDRIDMNTMSALSKNLSIQILLFHIWKEK